MVRFVFIVSDPLLHTLYQFKFIFSRMLKYAIIFDRLPEPVDLDVIQRPAFPIHGDLNILALLVLRPF